MPTYRSATFQSGSTPIWAGDIAYRAPHRKGKAVHFSPGVPQMVVDLMEVP